MLKMWLVADLSTIYSIAMHVCLILQYGKVNPCEACLCFRHHTMKCSSEIDVDFGSIFYLDPQLGCMDKPF